MTEFVKVEGLEDVRARLVNLPLHLRKKVMFSLLRKAAAPIIKAAMLNAPVAKKATRRVIPGLVKGSIRTAISKFKRGANGEFGIYIKPLVPGKVKSLQRRARKGGFAVNFGDPFYYKFQEFGFHAVGRTRVAGGKKRRAATLASGKYRFIPGKAFLGRAFASAKGAALAIFNVGIVDAITDQFNKRAK